MQVLNSKVAHPAFEVIGEDRGSPWLVTCDHASNKVPDDIGGGDLGLSADDMERHIAYDIGSAGVTRHLADLLQAPAILTKFSRLVIDPNRGEDDPTLVMRLYDGTIIPGNRTIVRAEIERRLNAYYRPYHAAYEALAARRNETAIVAIHSFTPRLASRAKRPWHIGILYGQDDWLAGPMLQKLQMMSDLCVGKNEPYAGYLPGDSIDRHGLKPKRPNVLIELRQDLIASEAGQREWAARLAPMLQEVLKNMQDQKVGT